MKHIVLSKATLFFLSLDRKFPVVGVVAAFFDNARQIVRSGLRECMQLVVLARLGLDCQMQGSSLVSFSFDRFLLVNASEVSLRFVG